MRLRYFATPSGLIFVAIGGLIAFAIAATVVQAVTEAQCQARGWPSYSVTWNFTRYCIRRIDQTDVVARLDTLR